MYNSSWVLKLERNINERIIEEKNSARVPPKAHANSELLYVESLMDACGCTK